MKRCTLYGLAATAALAASAGASERPQQLIIPDTVSGPPRRVTVEDMAALRRIDVLSLSPDGRHFAIFVRQAVAATNSYRQGWFVGGTQGGALIPLGDGGEARLAAGLNNRIIGGEFERPSVRWSADGKWLAYTLRRNGEVQLWRSRSDGSVQEQLTHNAADVRQFEWSKDGQSLYFTVGTTRAELAVRQEAKERRGYHYDSELNGFTDFMLPRLDQPADVDAATWVLALRSGQERLANESERGEFTRLHAAVGGGGVSHAAAHLVTSFVQRADGAQAWASRPEANTATFRMHAALPVSGSKPIQCAAEECAGFITRIWWRDEQTVLFFRYEGVGLASQGLYAWSPATGAVSSLLRTSGDLLTNCEQAAENRLACVRETPTRPSHVATIDLKSGAVQTIADVNPEFRHITLGKVERFEWDTPKFAWSEPGAQLHGIYADRAFGYVLYPPDFAPAKKYPVFISPYAAGGFDNGTNQEYALHALAASGFLVLSTQFPAAALDMPARLGPEYMKVVYSAEQGFPHLSMYMESTLKALDVVAARGFVDAQRVGMGGVSHGTFVPLFTLQKHDRLAAVAVSSGTWSQFEYYWGTQSFRKALAGGPVWQPKPVGEGLEFWKQLELADNVETIEAPILMNAPASEMFGLIRLINHMAEAGKPYDAYVFPKETHLKWQPAHLQMIMQRNLDWFRFWLQSYEDPDAGKAEQYSRWRKLRELYELDRSQSNNVRPAASSFKGPRSAAAPAAAN